jgi:hypothetical protein
MDKVEIAAELDELSQAARANSNRRSLVSPQSRPANVLAEHR